MDWVALITTLITTILPLIINKGLPLATVKFALQRKQVWYQRLADAALEKGDVIAAFAIGEAAGLCGCLAEAESTDAQQQLLGSAQDAFSATKAQLAAAA